MLGFVIRALISAGGLWLAAYFLRPEVSFDSTSSLIIAVVVLGLVNAILRPILVLLTLPITILTLGIFLLLINAGLIVLVSHFVAGFHVRTWVAALETAVITGVISWVGHGLTAGDQHNNKN